MKVICKNTIRKLSKFEKATLIKKMPEYFSMNGNNLMFDIPDDAKELIRFNHNNDIVVVEPHNVHYDKNNRISNDAENIWVDIFLKK